MTGARDRRASLDKYRNPRELGLASVWATSALLPPTPLNIRPKVRIGNNLNNLMPFKTVEEATTLFQRWQKDEDIRGNHFHLGMSMRCLLDRS